MRIILDGIEILTAETPIIIAERNISVSQITRDSIECNYTANPYNAQYKVCYAEIYLAERGL